MRRSILTLVLLGLAAGCAHSRYVPGEGEYPPTAEEEAARQRIRRRWSFCIGPRSSRNISSPEEAAAVAAVAVTVVAVEYLLDHDGHFHKRTCGHPMKKINGQRAYFYDGRWEYHDGGKWYTFPGEPPPPGWIAPAPKPSPEGTPESRHPNAPL